MARAAPERVRVARATGPVASRAHRSPPRAASPGRPPAHPAGHAPAVGRGLGTGAVQHLQATAGNQAVAQLLRDTAGAPAFARAPDPKARDRAVDVVEAIVHVLSSRGLSGDVGPQGENISSPRYAVEVTKTVTEPEHVALLMVWHLIAVGDPITHGDVAKVAESHAKTSKLVAAMQADRSAGKRAADLAARYAKAHEELAQRASREQVDDMIDAGVAEAQRPRGRAGASEDAQLLAAIDQARQVVHKWNGVVRRVVAPDTAAKQQSGLQARAYKRDEALFLKQVEDGLDPAVPWTQQIKRAGGLGWPEGIHLIQGGLDAAAAILAVTDPKQRADLFAARSNIFGTVAQGATITKVLLQFVSGSVAIGGAGAYAVAKLLGQTATATRLLDTTVTRIANANAAMNVAGVVHGTFVLLDPDATSNEKAAAAVEVAYSAIGIASFASKWTPRLAAAARWSGPISASLMINFEVFKWLADKRHKAQVGLNRLDWVSCHKATKAAAIEVQSWQRRLAVVNAILATEKDPRRRKALQGYAEAFRMELVERQLTPFVQARLKSKSMDDDAVSCGPAFTERLRPMAAQLGSAKGDDDAAMATASSFLLIVERAFTEWDKIVMSPT